MITPSIKGVIHALPTSGSTENDNIPDVPVFAVGSTPNTDHSQTPFFHPVLTSLPRHKAPGYSSQMQPTHTPQNFREHQPCAVGSVTVVASTYCE